MELYLGYELLYSETSWKNTDYIYILILELIHVH